jgi:hypothetical protein
MEPGQQSRDAIDDVLATDAAERHHGDGLSFDASATTLSPYQKRVPLVQDYYSPGNIIPVEGKQGQFERVINYFPARGLYAHGVHVQPVSKQNGEWVDDGKDHWHRAWPSDSDLKRGPVARSATEAQGNNYSQAQHAPEQSAADLAGHKIDHEWTAFAPNSGTLGLERSAMPQVKAEHRGALTQFLKGRGITHEQEVVDPHTLKPTQREFSPAKVDQARQHQGEDRAILVSNDGHILDGHHQWLAKLEQNEPIRVIRFDAPITKLIPLAHEFPSAEVADGATEAAAAPAPDTGSPAAGTTATGLSVGKTPNSTEAITVRDGVVHIGNYPAQDFDTGADVAVAPDASPQQIKDALIKAKAIGHDNKIFGMPKATPATPAAPEHAESAAHAVDPLDAELQDALGHLGDVLGDMFGSKLNATGPQHGAGDLLPALSKVIELLVRKGFRSLNAAVGAAAKAMRGNAATAPYVDQISARQWKAAYNAIAEYHDGTDSEDVVAALTADEVQQIVATPAAAVPVQEQPDPQHREIGVPEVPARLNPKGFEEGDTVYEPDNFGGWKEGKITDWRRINEGDRFEVLVAMVTSPEGFDHGADPSRLYTADEVASAKQVGKSKATAAPAVTEPELTTQQLNKLSIKAMTDAQLLRAREDLPKRAKPIAAEIALRGLDTVTRTDVPETADADTTPAASGDADEKSKPGPTVRIPTIRGYVNILASELGIQRDSFAFTEDGATFNLADGTPVVVRATDTTSARPADATSRDYGLAVDGKPVATFTVNSDDDVSNVSTASKAARVRKAIDFFDYAHVYFERARAAAAREANAQPAPAAEVAAAPADAPHHGIAVGEAFDHWFGKSEVVDAQGKPLPVYRGEHGAGADWQTRHGSWSFTSESSAAEQYASVPNSGDDQHSVNPRVLVAYLRIENPLINDKEDPFIEGAVLVRALGQAEAVRIARKFADHVENTSNWQEEINAADDFASVDAFLSRHPERVGELYFDAYPYLDDKAEVAKLRAAGYDGAIHGGNGETALTPEYKVFSLDQVWVPPSEGAASPVHLEGSPAYADLEARGKTNDAKVDALSDDQVRAMYAAMDLAGGKQGVEAMRATIKAEHPDDVEAGLQALADQDLVREHFGTPGQPAMAEQPAPTTPQPAPAAQHIEAGHAEPATPTVIAQSLQKEAARTLIDYKTAKANLIAQIDAAIAVAPEKDRTTNGQETELHAAAQQYADAVEAVRKLPPGRGDMAKLALVGKRLKAARAAANYVTFNVPGDGEFQVLNTVEKLQEFKKRAIDSKGFDPLPKRRATSSGPRLVTGSDNPTVAIRDMLEQGEQAAAYELAKTIGEPFRFTPNTAQGATGPNLYLDARDIPDMAHGITGYVGRRYGAKKAPWYFIESRTGMHIGDPATSAAAAEKSARDKLKATNPDTLANAIVKMAATVPDQAALEAAWLAAAEKSDQQFADNEDAKSQAAARLRAQLEETERKSAEAVAAKRAAEAATPEGRIKAAGFQIVTGSLKAGNGVEVRHPGSAKLGQISLHDRARDTYRAYVGTTRSSPGISLDDAITWLKNWYADEAKTKAPTPVAPTVPKIGDPATIMGTDAILADSREIDGVRYELYNANSISDKRGFVRVVEVDSGERLDLRRYDDYDAAEKSFKGDVEAAQRAAAPAAASDDPDLHGYAYAIVKDGRILTSGSLPAPQYGTPSERTRLSHFKARADQMEGDLYLGSYPDAGDVRPQGHLIMGMTWDEIQARQQKQRIDRDQPKGKMPKDAALVYSSAPKAEATPAGKDADQPQALTGPVRDPFKVNFTNPYQDGDIVKIDGKPWQVRNDTAGWYLTDTGNWRGTHPVVRDVKSMNNLIGMVEQQAAATPASAAPDTRAAFEHDGTKIYPITMKDGPRWAVQTLENKGTKETFGDNIFTDIEDAKAQAERANHEAAQSAERAAERVREAADAEARKEANRGKSVTERRADAVLDKATKLPPQAGLGNGTRREAMEKAVEQGRAVVEKMVEDTAARKRGEEAIARMSRAGYMIDHSNPNLPLVKEAREARDRLKADNYRKPEYRVYAGNTTEGAFYEISKTEYDYAKSLMEKAAAPETVAQPAEGTATPEPWQMTRDDYANEQSRAYIDKRGGNVPAKAGNDVYSHAYRQHERLVSEAIARGDDVPAEVRAEYQKDEAPATPTDDTLTPEQAQKQMTWRDLGQRDGVTTHRLMFNEDGPGDGSGSITIANVQKIGNGKWQVDDDGERYDGLRDAKKAATAAGIAYLRREGYVSKEGDETQSANDAVEAAGFTVVGTGALGGEFANGKKIEVSHPGSRTIGQIRQYDTSKNTFQGYAYNSHSAPDMPLPAVIQWLKDWYKHEDTSGGPTQDAADSHTIPLGPVNLAEHARTMQALEDGELPLAAYKGNYERTLASEAAIKAELNATKKDDLLIQGGPSFAYRYKNDNKERIVNGLYEHMLMDYVLTTDGMFSYGMDGPRPAIAKKVAAMTADGLQAYAVAVRKERAEYEAKREARTASMADPQTIDDFKALLSSRMREDNLSFTQARLTLTLEQRAKYDDLVATAVRAARATRKVQQQEQAMRAPGEPLTATETIQTRHTKHGHDLWQFNLDQRVSNDEFKDLVAKARRLGGDYSSYRGNGALPGWQFRTPEAATAFKALLAGDASAAKEVLEARRDAFADDKSQSAAERLTEMADRLAQQADDAAGVERKANTARRARFAAAADAAVRANRALAATMRHLAAAITDGSAKFLDRVRTRTQLDQISSTLSVAQYPYLKAKHGANFNYEKHRHDPVTVETADYAEWPSYTAFRSDLAALGRQLLDTEGTKKLGQAIMKVANDVSEAYLKFAKDNLLQVGTFATRDGQRAAFASKEAAEAAIARSGYRGKAIVLPVKRGENLIIMSPSEAIERGIWQGDGDKRITLDPEFGAELVEKLGKVNRRKERVAVPHQFERAHTQLALWARMNIESPAEMRAALREYIGLREAPKEADKVKELERAMVGRRNDGMDFFPTPEAQAAEMVAVADLQAGMRVLEPSAGMGHIADLIREAGVEPDVVEMSGERRELLEAKGYNLVGHDFMDLKETPRGYTFGDLMEAPDGNRGILRGLGGMGSDRVRLVDQNDPARVLGYYNFSELEGVALLGHGSGYDRIIMNPPFSDRRDAQHVMHAYSLLKPGGRLVAIMGEGVFFGQDKKAQAFRDWLDAHGGTSEKLAEGTFMDPSLPVTTGVNARMVVIDKPAAGAEDGAAQQTDALMGNLRTAPGFYSELARQIAAVPDKQANMPADQWAAWLRANAGKLGIKKDEIEWSGITDYLVLRGKDKVSRDELGAYLDQHGVQVQEVLKGALVSVEEKQNRLTEEYNVWLAENGLPEVSADELPYEAELTPEQEEFATDFVERWEAAEDPEATDAQYPKFVLPGGENYRELLLTLPTGGPSVLEALSDAQLRALIERNDHNADTDGVGRADLLAMISHMDLDSTDLARLTGKNTADYKSPHWGEPNVLAHIRFNERTDADGNRVLFIEELQSDWQAAGKRHGFDTGEERPTDGMTAEPFDHHAPFGWWRVRDRDGNFIISINAYALFQRLGRSFEEPMTAELAIEEAQRQVAQGHRPAYQRNLVPKAPFVTKTEGWLNLAIKRMLMYAAEHGYDKVAFINGQQSANRYDLSQRVDQIVVDHDDSDDYEVTAVKDGEVVLEKRHLSPAALAETIGKELADQAIAGLKTTEPHILEGDGLKVGGEGMKAFYDQIVPQAVNDVLKKLGGAAPFELPLIEPPTEEQDEFGRAATHDYVGPHYTLAQLKRKTVRDDADLNEQLKTVRHTMRYYGDSFATAMLRYGSPELATRLGGQMLERTEKKEPPPAVKQLAIDITPELRDKATAGLPLFLRHAAAPGSLDQALHAAVQDGVSAAEVLGKIAADSANPLNRALAAKMLEMGVNPSVGPGSSAGRTFTSGVAADHHAAGYDPVMHHVVLFDGAGAERNLLHEFAHAATAQALRAGGKAALQIKALFADVRRHPALRGLYGVTNIDEFVAEAHSNPAFQAALAAIPSGNRSLWQRFLDIVAHAVFGFERRQTNMLAEVLEAGRGLMAENSGRADAKPMGTSRLSAAVSRVGLHFKDSVKRTPALAEAANRLMKGEIDRDEYDMLVNLFKPVEPYQDVPEPATTEQMRTALTKDKVPKLNAADAALGAGQFVGIRLDIPAYRDHGAWIVAVHEGKREGKGGQAGKPIGYQSTAHIRHPNLAMAESGALKIAAGAAKNTLATIGGEWVKSSPQEATALARQALNDPAWVQVGIDPERHSYFYDRATMEPVVSGTEAIQIGGLVLVKHPVYADKREFLFAQREGTAPGAIMGNLRAAPGFYSELARQIAAVPDKQANMPADQWAAWLRANAGKLGIKKDEIEWSGITDYLALRDQDKVSRDELGAYLDQNGVQVQEVEKVEKDTSGVTADLLRSVRERLPQETALLEEQGFQLVPHPDEAGPLGFEHSDDGEWMNAADLKLIYGVNAQTHAAAQRLAAAYAFATPNPDTTRYGQHTLPGGKNYHELLLTLPDRETAQPSRAEPPRLVTNADGKTDVVLDGRVLATFGTRRKAATFALRNMGERQTAINKANKATEQSSYQSSHWDEPNVLAHVRFNDRTDADGQRVLFIEELQSDWGQAGKKEGFQDETLDKLLAAAVHGGMTEAQAVADIDDLLRQPLTTAKFDRSGQWERLTRATEGSGINLNYIFHDADFGVPSAPFVTSTEGWLQLAIKRMVTYAAEHGYDKVAFINGQQATDRFDLSKLADKVEWNPKTATLVAFKDDDIVTTARDATEAKLPDIVGKEVAQKLIEAPLRNESIKSVSGVDLKVGGAGMKAFYDKIVPQTVNDVLKKLGGGKVEMVDMRAPENEQDGQLVYGQAQKDALHTAQPGFTITDDLRVKAGAGLPLFDLTARREAAAARAANAALARRAGLEAPKAQRTSALLKLRQAFKRLAAAPATEQQPATELFVAKVEALLDGLEDKAANRAAKRLTASRQRGADFVRERLLNASRHGHIDAATADMADWFIRQNPALVDDLGIAVRTAKGANEGSAGRYDEFARVMTLFKGADNDGTAVHEILHHLERLMPAAMQGAIRTEYFKQVAAQLANREASAGTRAYLEAALEAFVTGDPKAAKRALELVDQAPDGFYQYFNPSEFWAVNATRLMARRYAAQDSIWSRLHGWLQDALQHIRGVLGLSSDAPVLRALAQVLGRDSGLREVGSQMLSDGRSFNDPAKPRTTRRAKMRAQTATEAFKNWFGDSKVTNSDGTPMVVYHGTGRSRFSVYRIPAFFSEDRDGAKWYAIENGDADKPGPIHEAFLSIRNPLDIGSSRAGSFKLIDLARAAGVNVILEEYPDGTWSFEAPEVAEHSNYDGTNLPDLVYIPAVRDALLAAGYDGIRAMDTMTNYEIPIWIALKPEQIKSATGNDGSFDPANADIMYSARDDDGQSDPANGTIARKNNLLTAKEKKLYDKLPEAVRNDPRYRYASEAMRDPKTARRWRDELRAFEKQTYPGDLNGVYSLDDDGNVNVLSRGAAAVRAVMPFAEERGLGLVVRRSAGQLLQDLRGYMDAGLALDSPPVGLPDRYLNTLIASKDMFGIPLFSRVADDDEQRSVTRRQFLGAAALAATSGSAHAGTTLGKATPVPAAVLAQPLPAKVANTLRGQGSGITNIEGAKAIGAALREIAASGPKELRALAAQIGAMLPEDGVMLTVDDDRVMNAHGAVSLTPFVHLQLFTAGGRTGLTYETFLHESLHLVVAARYKALSSGTVRSNDAVLKMATPNAAKALAQFSALWDEFEAAARDNPSLDAATKLSIREAVGSPDEFFVRALTDPHLQRYMAGIEYQGKSLLERFKDWVTGLFFKDGVRPSWLDAALLASNELARAMPADRPDFARLNASNRLASRQDSALHSAADQTGTQAFRGWFGDSKVVNPDGTPKVVYHGTLRDFDAFQPPSTFGAVRARTWGGKALGKRKMMFFAGDTETANGYAHDKRVRSPGGANVKPVYLSIQNPAIIEGNGRLWSDVQADLHAAYDSGQYDGAILRNVEDNFAPTDRTSDTYVAFDPGQIKSATGNAGTFDPTNPDILRSAVNEPGGPLMGNLRDPVGSTLRRVVVNNVRGSGHKWTDFRSIGLQFLGRRQLVEVYASQVPALEDYSALVQKMDAEKNEAGAGADEIARTWGNLKDEKALAELMHDATLAQIDPSKPYNYADDRETWTLLKDRYAALSDGARRVYQDASAAYTAHYAKVQQAIRQRIARAVLSAPARARLMERMDADFFGKVKGVYFPLARFGKYVVVVRAANGDKISVTRAETMAEAETARATLRTKFPASYGFVVGKVLKDAEFNAARDAVGAASSRTCSGCSTSTARSLPNSRTTSTSCT